MKYLLLTLSLSLFLTAARPQAMIRPDTSHRFLWFSGHWSTTQKKTFIFTGAGGSGAGVGAGQDDGSGAGGGTGPGGGSGPGGSGPDGGSGPGGTITISDDGSVHISGPGVDAWNKMVDQALQSEQQFLQQLDNPKDNLDPPTHQLHQLLEPDARQQVKDLQDLKIDPNQNILTPDAKPGQASPPTLNQVTAQYCEQVKADYDEVISYWKAHARDKDADLNYPPPPTFEYDCYACDSTLRNTEQQTVDKYVEDFYKEERRLATKAFGILGQMARLGVDESGVMDESTYNDLFATNKKNPSRSGACS
ncbi:MAG TPA: hypothetical protein VN616_04670, partial [Puia sp.]|nr:hypothetical protein [Puia sp.]